MFSGSEHVSIWQSCPQKLEDELEKTPRIVLGFLLRCVRPTIRTYWYGIDLACCRKLYWTSRVVYVYWNNTEELGPRAVSVSELDGTNIRRLFNGSDTYAPRAITVHPAKG